MVSFREVVRWTLTLGGRQNYLGARWVTEALKRAPAHDREAWALKLLSLSPHYFFKRDYPEYAHLSEADYRKAFFEEGRRSRETIYNKLLAPMGLGDVILDYGCGPGLLARVLAQHAEQVYACDISSGAIACARILNPAPNLTYVTADESGLSTVPDATIDTVISLNMVQHLTVDAYQRVLAQMAKKCRTGGKLILHIQLEAPNWKTEEEWLADTSIKGRLRNRFALYCFALPEERHRSMVAEHGFKDVEVRPVSSFTDRPFDDIGQQHILTARR